MYPTSFTTFTLIAVLCWSVTIVNMVKAQLEHLNFNCGTFCTTVSTASHKMSCVSIACVRVNADQRVCSHDNNTHSKAVSLATVFHWLLQDNTPRHECNMSTRQDGWYANYKRGEVTDSVNFCSTFSTRILISR